MLLHSRRWDTPGTNSKISSSYYVYHGLQCHHALKTLSMFTRLTLMNLSIYRVSPKYVISYDIDRLSPGWSMLLALLILD